MKTYYTIVLAKKPPVADEEDWPRSKNCACKCMAYRQLDLYRLANTFIDNPPAPWWWIFDGEINEDNLILSGAIDPDDIEIIKEHLS